MNDGPAWQPTNDWFLRLRAKGIAVILSHHPNRAGSQLGTITKTWNINNLLELKKATPADGEECCCFNIAVSKERGLGIKLAGRNYIFRNRIWTTESKKLDTAALRKAAVIFLLAENKHTQEYIAAEVGLDRSRISHIKREGISTNLLIEDGGNLSLTQAGQLYLDKHFKENFKMILLGVNDDG